MAFTTDWPTIAADPDWVLRQGPTFQRSLADGREVVGEIVWSTDRGFTAMVTEVGDLTADDLFTLAQLLHDMAVTITDLRRQEVEA